MKVWPKRMSEQAVSRFRSSALESFKVSRKYFLQEYINKSNVIQMNGSSVRIYLEFTRTKTKRLTLWRISNS